MFAALEKANNSLRPIVIGSLWRRCAARRGVAKVRSNVATFFMSQYTNFIQFGGESDGATRCAQVTQLLAAAWAKHSNENPLVVIQLDIVNAYPSADWQAQFDVLAGRASKCTTTGMCTCEMTSPVLIPYATIGEKLRIHARYCFHFALQRLPGSGS